MLLRERKASHLRLWQWIGGKSSRSMLYCSQDRLIFIAKFHIPNTVQLNLIDQYAHPKSEPSS